ncbi:hypothetical protein SAMN05216232_0371 [Virgibacillus subterraneus]|uniref:DNA phosphorothioation-dependent restriction protein DptF n=1 Tax=Virgibacillus subterraneus TaxID=621109 RepID=A0A1H8ZBS1_9BACI|nr:hypothetical protein [Virgibacillus subterraneus]SEP61879.1 hypothetical protein SAMN05216232_0371 [Virgibacillus subterraneus]
MSVVKSEWINFLRQYGPIPRNDNMYDEAIQRSIDKKGIKPIKVEPQHLSDLIANFETSYPQNIILTGTAGDGKTFYCREVWFALGGTKEAWDNGETIKTIPLENHSLYVIKDLSELSDMSSYIINEMAESIKQGNRKVFLVAANDGQLLEKWKSENHNYFVTEVADCIEDLLVSEQQIRKGYNLQLINLSKTNSARIFPQIVNSVINHPGWSNCDNCSLKDNESIGLRCPIWENKKRLEGTNDGKIIQERLVDLLELCELNEVHIPIRQLLLLISNMILGHPNARDKLMSCTQIPKILESNSVSGASIYRNIFGENLSDRRRESTDIFSTLNRFGIGTESNNFIDNILIFGEDDPELYDLFNKYMISDKFYGADETFRAEQKSYLEGEVSKEESEDFLSRLRSQRQRLFFTVNSNDLEEIQVWELTTFKYAGEFLEKIHRRLENNKRVQAKLLSRLVKGINRISTGLLTKDSDVVYLSTSGSHSQSKISRVYESEVSVRPDRGESVNIVHENDKPVFKVNMSLSDEVEAVHLKLHLVRYEFISRVAEGELPGSFSRECYEDILAFKSRLLTHLEHRRKIEGAYEIDTDRLVLELLQINDEGMLYRRAVEVDFE